MTFFYLFYAIRNMFNKLGLVSLFAVSLVLTGCFGQPASQDAQDMTTGATETGTMDAMMEETNSEMDAMMGTGTTGTTGTMMEETTTGAGSTGAMMDKTAGN
jgi:hypothetical protein